MIFHRYCQKRSRAITGFLIEFAGTGKVEFKIDYIECVEANSLERISKIKGKVLIAVAGIICIALFVIEFDRVKAYLFTLGTTHMNLQ